MSTDPAPTPTLVDVRYAVDENPQHVLDVYLPSAGPEDRLWPTILYVHGGGWLVGDKDWLRGEGGLPELVRLLTSNGFAVAAVNYRLSGEAHFPAPLDDVRSALQFLRAGGSRLGVDAGAIALAGDSAGAHLALLTAFTEQPGSSPAPVRAVISYYGVTDLGTVLQQRRRRVDQGLPIYGDLPPGGVPITPPTPEGMMLGVEPDAPGAEILASEASPIAHVHANVPATLIVHGRQDSIAPVEQAIRLQARLEVAGARNTLELLDAGHAEGVFFTDPGVNAAVLSFLDEHLRTPLTVTAGTEGDVE